MKKIKSRKAHVKAESSYSDKNPLLLYMQEINRIPLLRKDEEEKLARLAAQGNMAARERLVNSNLRFVIMVAKKYQGKGMPLEDLISEGNMGLLNAVEHFNVEKGCRFITYAVWWIRQSIIKAINEKGRMIRLPYNKTNEVKNMAKTREAIQNEQSRKKGAEIKEIAMLLDMAPEKAANLMKISQDVVSLDEPALKHESSLAIKDLIEDEYSASPVEHAENNILKDELETVLGILEKRAAEVIRCRYGLGDSGPMTLKEIGNRYHLSRERVRQIENRALRQLKKSSQSRKLKSYIA